MITNIIDISNFSLLTQTEIENLIYKASEEIKQDGVVAFPTETVYGLGANALSKYAVQKIFEIKGRPSDNPLIVHIASIDHIEKLIDIKKDEIGDLILQRLNKAINFWPGPVSFIFPANLKEIPFITLGNLRTVAIRFPDNKVAQIFIKLSNLPIAAPSANISGKPSCTKAEDVLMDFNGKIKYILNGGESVYGIESTVVDLTSDIPTILRPGFITLEDLLPEFPDIVYLKKVPLQENPRSPGMKYTHYKPDAKVVLIFNKNEFEDNEGFFELKRIFSNKIIKISELPDEFFKNNKFIFLSQKQKIELKTNIIDITEELIFKDPYDFARRIYSIFRDADKKKINYIIIEPCLKHSGINLAIINRLIKAAEEIWII